MSTIDKDVAMFQPTLPLRGATFAATSAAWSSEFQPTLPLRGATHLRQRDRLQLRVSTHAPLAGSDHPVHGFALHAKEVSTHAPLAGSDEGHVGTLRFEF